MQSVGRFLGVVFFLAAMGRTLTMTWADEEPSPVEDVVFRAEYDGSAQRYLLIRPKTKEGEDMVDLLVYLHGHGSDRHQIFADRAETRSVREFARRYGTLLVSPDYRASTSWMGPAAEADVSQILGELSDRFCVRHVILTGGSMGGTSALTFAVLHPNRIAGVVAFNPLANHLEFEHFQDAITESFGGSKRDFPDEYKRRSAEYFPERLSMPTAITLGGLDTVVPPDSAARLASVAAKLHDQVLLIFRPEGGHETDDADACSSLEFIFSLVNRVD